MATDKKKENSQVRHTYAVYGLTEWYPILAVGAARIRIPFTGGSLSGYGCVPATFTTSSQALAGIIENSTYFKIRRIRKL